MRVVLESRACEKIHNLNFDPVGRRLRSVLGNREGSFVALVGLGSDPWLASPNISAQPQRGARRISDCDDRLNRHSHDSCRIASEAPRGFLRHCRNILIIVRLLYPTHYSRGVSLAWSFTRANPQMTATPNTALQRTAALAFSCRSAALSSTGSSTACAPAATPSTCRAFASPRFAHTRASRLRSLNFWSFGIAPPIFFTYESRK